MFRFADRAARKFMDKFALGNSRFYVFATQVKAFLKRSIRPTALESLDICIAEHCNLSCYSCNHFSPLAEPEFSNLDNTEKDLQRLAELSDGNIPKIYIVGGEPLLNPQIIEYMRISRRNFPNSIVEIITNGLLLLAQKDIFWQSLTKYNVSLKATKYPGIKWEKIEEKAGKFKCSFSYFDFSGNTEKTSRKYRLDLSGSQNIKKSFRNCCLASCAVAVQNGRIAACPFVFNIRHFNKYFNQNIPVCGKDYIDIYKAKSMQEIVDFVNTPFPLCRFCKSIGIEIAGKWRIGERKIEEWS